MPDIEQVILPDNVTYDIRDTSKLATSLKGAANGLAELDINGVVPSNQLPVLERSDSGSLVSFNDGGDNIPLKSLIANITAVQSGTGTPSPSNVRAISGWSGANVSRTGKNLFPISSGSGVGFIFGGNSAETSLKLRLCAGKYAFSQTFNNGGSGAVNFKIWKPNGTLFRDVTVTSSKTGFWIGFEITDEGLYSFSEYSNGGNNVITNIQLEMGSETESTAYEPFGIQITLPFGQTVYGGTLDVLSGVLRVTHEIIDLSSLSWTSTTSGTSNIWRASSPTNCKGYADSVVPTNILAEKYVADSVDNIYASVAPNNAFAIRQSQNLIYVMRIDENTPTGNLVYELATPVTYQLTPAQVSTLLGLNNIFADTGDISLSYFTQNANAINDIAESNTRTALNTDVPKTDLTDIFVTGEKNNTGATITKNKFFYLNGTLVVAKADISANADLTLNTNYVVATAKVLNGLYNVLQTVTPTSSDKLLVVQPAGQGLVSWGSKLDSANPTGTGALSLNRSGSTGSYSATLGRNCEASAAYSLAEGYACTASNNCGHAEGDTTTASGDTSHSEGFNTIANHRCQHVFGMFNDADSSSQPSSSRGNYVEIVGNGTGSNARSNARTLDWSGNEVLAGGLKINGSDNVLIASNVCVPNSNYIGVDYTLTPYHVTTSTNLAQSARLRYAYNGNILTIGGRVVMNIATRTGDAAGIVIPLMSGKKIKHAIDMIIGISCYVQGARNGEGTMIVASANGTEFRISTTETYENVQTGKDLVLYVPPLNIELI